MFMAPFYLFGSFIYFWLFLREIFQKNFIYFLAFDTKRQLSFLQTELKIEDYGKDRFFTRAGVRNSINIDLSGIGKK